MKKLFFNNKPAMTLYGDLLAGIKIRIRQAQNRAVMSANAEMLCLYWDIGRMVAEKQDAEGWGTAVIPRLSLDLRSDLPKIKGFSERNIRRMIQFYKEYPGLFLNWPRPVAKLGDAAASPDFRPQPVAKFDPNDSAQPAQGLGEDQVVQLPWAHNVILIQKLKDLPTRFWYARQAIAQGWSRDTLAAMIKSHAYKRQGAAVTNFDMRLQEPHAQLAKATLKDPYRFIRTHISSTRSDL
jgi:predicted nuclease of restriction endonuclease-like (RecB) superfamily